MKRLFACIFFIVFFSTGTFAQFVDDSLRYAESIWAMKKKAMILDQMTLTEAEKSAFWPVYESYSNAVQYLDMEYLRLLEYSLEEGLSQKRLESVCEHLLENELLLAKTRKQYYRKFKKALSPGQAGQFMQLDNDFRTYIRIEIQGETPAFVSSQNKLYTQN